MDKDMTLFLYTRDDVKYANTTGAKYDVLYEITWLEMASRLIRLDIDYEYDFLAHFINQYINVSRWTGTNIQGEIELETKFMKDYENETFNQVIVDTIIKYREIFVSPEFVLWFIKHSERNDEKRFEL